MRRKKKVSISDLVIGLVLLLLALICILPFLNILAISFSDKTMALAGLVGFWPKKFTTSAYEYILSQKALWKSFRISVVRVVIATVLSTLCTLITAYPLSMSKYQFPKRTVYVWYFFITTLISGGLIPGYLLILYLGLMDSIWALVLPSIVNVFNIIVMLNFYRQLPSALSEAAMMDGASHWDILFRIYVPLSMPAIATIVLFTICGHWNSWFDGSIYMDSRNYPLATYLQSVIVSSTNIVSGMDYEQIMAISDKTVRAATIVVAALPMMVIYPFLQKYFVKGLVLGGVKE